MSTTTTTRMQGVLGDSLITDIIMQWGPVLGPIVLKWLEQYLFSGQQKTALPTPDQIRHFIAQILRQHKAEVLAALAVEEAIIYDGLVDAIDPPQLGSKA